MAVFAVYSAKLPAMTKPNKQKGRRVTRPNMMTLRLSDTGWTQIEKLAQEFDVPKATVMRAMLVVALQHEAKLREALQALALDGGI